MARYIDADIAIEEINKLQDSLANSNDILWKINKPIYKGLCNARGIINDTPTADVVPRAMIEEIFLRIREEFSISELGKSALNQLEAELKKKYTGEE